MKSYCAIPKKYSAKDLGGRGMSEEIELFMALEKDNVAELSYSTFVSSLTFPTDLIDYLNLLNFNLKGLKQIITMMYDSVKCLKFEFLL